MSKLSDFDEECKAVTSAIDYWKGFIDALESLKRFPDIEKQIQLSKDSLEDYKERLNDLRKEAKRNPKPKRKSKNAR